LDKTQYWLVYELEDGMYLVIDGNHRRIILIDKKIESWPCRVIPKEEVILSHFIIIYFILEINSN
jgi:hypothetical protein